MKNNKNRENCLYCGLSQRHHFFSHLDYYAGKILWNHCIAIGSFVLLKINQAESGIMQAFFRPLAHVGIVQFVDNPDETKFCNRSFIFFREAKKRGLQIKAIKIFWKYTLSFELTYNGKKYFYVGTPLNIKSTSHLVDDKIALKKIFAVNNIPFACGQIFVSLKKAVAYSKKISYPLVVKPNNSSLSRHVTCNIKTEDELIKAIKIAKMLKPDFIVEEFVQGNLYRATVVGQKKVFVCQKELANVIGDGKSSVKELLEKKNAHALRGREEDTHYTLHKIPADQVLGRRLSESGLGLGSILPIGKKIILQDKYILSRGCDIIGCTGKVHADNIALFIEIARILKTDIIGIDFICPNIAATHKSQVTAVLETNSLPYIDMHQHPSHGNAEPVASIVWDMVLEKL